METTPKFLQGVFAFTGHGLGAARLLNDALVYVVPTDKRSQLIYIRAGNSDGDMVALVLMRDGKPMRYIPIGAKAATHVSLAVVEDLMPDTKLEVFIAAPVGSSGELVLDIGLLEI